MPRPALFSLRAWRKRARELTEMYALPLCGALLPWPLTRRLLARLAAHQSWYRDEVQPAEEHAHRAGFAPDRAAFGRRMRWRLLIEHMDGFLVPLRSRRYLRRWVRAEGDPLPAQGPVMFIGSHFGCGYWFLPLVRAHGLPPNIVAPQLGPLLARSSLLQNLYTRMRHRLLTFATGRPLVYRGNAVAALTELMRAGQVTFGLCDIPTTREDAVEVELCGRRTRLADSMFALAARESVPVYLFVSDTELETGLRRVHFERAEGDPRAQVQQFARLIDRHIQRDPSGWRFWSIAPSFFPELQR